MVPKLLVCGHANVDVLLRVDRLPGQGESRPVQDRQTVYGGTACNIARHASALGCPATLWALAGPDFPLEWLTALQDDGVDTAALDRTGSRTPTCYIFTTDEGHQSYCMDQGAMAGMRDHPPSPNLLAGRRFLHIATGAPEAYLPLAEAAQQQGIEVALDPGQEIHFAYTPATFEALLNQANTLFLNEVELDVALRFMKYGDPVQFLDHVDRVIVTRGAEGADLYNGKHTHVPALDVTAVDPTGAGDALRGGWYAGRTSGDDVACLQLGVRAAGFQVQHRGPQEVVPRPRDLGQP